MELLTKNFFKNKRVLITGHTGFKGSWLSLWLDMLGAEILGYALEPSDNRNIYVVCDVDKRIESITANVCDLKKILKVFKTFKPEIVFHLAAQALVRYSYNNPVETYETNIMGTVNILEACRLTPSVKAVIIVTSDKCYKNNEWVWGYRENDTLGGKDPYSSSKGCAELVTEGYLRSFFNPAEYKTHGVGIASVRAGNVIGGGDWSQDRLIPDCIKAFINKEKITIRNPQATRPWQHVLEPLSGYMLLAEKLYKDGPEYSGPWNFGPDYKDTKTVAEIVEGVTSKLGYEKGWEIDRNSNPHESRYLMLDCTKAKMELKWEPRWNLENALKNASEWYKAFIERKNMLKITQEQINKYEQYPQ